MALVVTGIQGDAAKSELERLLRDRDADVRRSAALLLDTPQAQARVRVPDLLERIKTGSLGDRQVAARGEVQIKPCKGKKPEGEAHSALPSGQSAPGRVALLVEVLFCGFGVVEFGGPGFAGRDAKGLLQELAGLETVSAGIAFGLHGGLALWRDDHLNETGHAGSSGATRVCGSWCPAGRPR